MDSKQKTPAPRGRQKVLHLRLAVPDGDRTTVVIKRVPFWDVGDLPENLRRVVLELQRRFEGAINQ